MSVLIPFRERGKHTQSGYDQAFASPAMAPKIIRPCMLIVD